MNKINSDVSVRQLILVPALIALSITVIRLVGELGGGPSVLFNTAAGGAGALVGIVWLVPIFGGYFAVKLARGGHGPESAGKVVGYSLLGLLTFAVIMGLTVALTGDPNVSVSPSGAVFQQLGIRSWRAGRYSDSEKSVAVFLSDYAGLRFRLTHSRTHSYVRCHDG